VLFKHIHIVNCNTQSELNQGLNRKQMQIM